MKLSLFKIIPLLVGVLASPSIFAGTDFTITGSWTDSNTFSMQTHITHNASLADGGVDHTSIYTPSDDSTGVHPSVIGTANTQGIARARASLDASQKCLDAVTHFNNKFQSLDMSKMTPDFIDFDSVEKTINEVKNIRDSVFTGPWMKNRPEFDQANVAIQKAEQTLIQMRASVAKEMSRRKAVDDARNLAYANRTRTFEEVKYEMQWLERNGSPPNLLRSEAQIRSDYAAYLNAQHDAQYDFTQWNLSNDPPIIPSYPEAVLLPASRISQVIGLCFPGETPICINGNDSIAIKDLHEGDKVESCDLATKTCEIRPIQQVFKSKATHLIEFTFEGKSLRSTEDHPFYSVTAHAWVPAYQLHRGDTLATLDHRIVAIDEVQDLYGEFDVFNIDVEKHHNYYASGILVHNCNAVYDLAKEIWVRNTYPQIGIPHKPLVAYQSSSNEALAARTQVMNGQTIYRTGTTGRSQTGGDAQYWSFEHPQTSGYNHRYGIPPDNVSQPNFIETGVLKPGTPFITRPAPAAKADPTGGGGIEVVAPLDGVTITGHSSL